MCPVWELVVVSSSPGIIVLPVSLILLPVSFAFNSLVMLSTFCNSDSMVFLLEANYKWTKNYINFPIYHRSLTLFLSKSITLSFSCIATLVVRMSCAMSLILSAVCSFCCHLDLVFRMSSHGVGFQDALCWTSARGAGAGRTWGGEIEFSIGISDGLVVRGLPSHPTPDFGTLYTPLHLR